MCVLRPQTGFTQHRRPRHLDLLGAQREVATIWSFPQPVQALISLREEGESVERMLMDMTILDIALRLTATSPQAVDNCAVAFPISLIFHTVKNSGRETERNPLSGIR